MDFLASIADMLGIKLGRQKSCTQKPLASFYGPQVATATYADKIESDLEDSSVRLSTPIKLIDLI